MKENMSWRPFEGRKTFRVNGIIDGFIEGRPGALLMVRIPGGNKEHQPLAAGQSQLWTTYILIIFFVALRLAGRFRWLAFEGPPQPSCRTWKSWAQACPKARPLFNDRVWWVGRDHSWLVKAETQLARLLPWLWLRVSDYLSSLSPPVRVDGQGRHCCRLANFKVTGYLPVVRVRAPQQQVSQTKKLYNLLLVRRKKNHNTTCYISYIQGNEGINKRLLGINQFYVICFPWSLCMLKACHRHVLILITRSKWKTIPWCLPTLQWPVSIPAQGHFSGWHWTLSLCQDEIEDMLLDLATPAANLCSITYRAIMSICPIYYLLKFCGILHNLKVVYQLLCSKFMAIHPFGGLV